MEQEEAYQLCHKYYDRLARLVELRASLDRRLHQRHPYLGMLVGETVADDRFLINIHRTADERKKLDVYMKLGERYVESIDKLEGQYELDSSVIVRDHQRCLLKPKSSVR